MAPICWKKAEFTISCDKNRVDLDALEDMLRDSHWAKDRPREKIRRSVEESICFSLFEHEQQIGFSRVLTDNMAYAVILDMVIRKDFRRQGLGEWLIRCICRHPDVAPLRQVLWTSTAENFYKKVGFQEIPNLTFMARSTPS